MSLALARRGRYVFRHLNLRDTLSVSARVPPLTRHVGHVHLATNGSHVDSVAPNGLYGSILPKILINSYATAAARPKAKTAKAKATKKRSASSKAGETKKTKKTKTTKAKSKELTEEEKEAKKAKALKKEIRELKAIALEPPKALPFTAHVLALKDVLAKRTKEPGKPPQQAFREAHAAVKALKPEELEHFARTAEANKAANAAAYADWLKKHTPLQIKQANDARRKLRRLLPEKKHKYPPIDDDRLVRRPRNAYAIFVKERFDSGDFKHMSIKETAARAADEWNSLTESEKEKYVKLQAADEERYRKEYKEVYGEEPPSPKSS